MGPGRRWSTRTGSPPAPGRNCESRAGRARRAREAERGMRASSCQLASYGWGTVEGNQDCAHWRAARAGVIHSRAFSAVGGGPQRALLARDFPRSRPTSTAHQTLLRTVAEAEWDSQSSSIPSSLDCPQALERERQIFTLPRDFSHKLSSDRRDRLANHRPAAERCGPVAHEASRCENSAFFSVRLNAARIMPPDAQQSARIDQAPFLCIVVDSRLIPAVAPNRAAGARPCSASRGLCSRRLAQKARAEPNEIGSRACREVFVSLCGVLSKGFGWVVAVHPRRKLMLSPSRAPWTR